MLHTPLATLLSAAFVTLASGQVPTRPEPVVAPEHARLRVQLTAPDQPVHVWAASEWILTFHNGTSLGFPFHEDLLTPKGYADADVSFEIARETSGIRMLDSKNCNQGSGCFEMDEARLEPGGSGTLHGVLHGEMVVDFEAHARGEDVDVRFVPAFEEPGRHLVTAVVRWGRSTLRSDPVEIRVRDAPVGSAHVLVELRRLAAAGVQLDVQGTGATLEEMEQVADFVETYRSTLYSDQLRFGLALSLFDLVPRAKNTHVALKSAARFEQVRALIAQEPPIDFALRRGWDLLRKAFDAEDALRLPRRLPAGAGPRGGAR